MELLTAFYNKMQDDHRIGPTHISLYIAIFHLYQTNGFVNPVPVNRALLMELSKIKGLATYHKCIKELQEGRCMQYQSSHDSRLSSKIILLK